MINIGKVCPNCDVEMETHVVDEDMVMLCGRKGIEYRCPKCYFIEFFGKMS